MSDYFDRLGTTLNNAGVFGLVLVIDRDRLRANVEAVKARLAGTELGVRLVVKSLPSPGLVDWLARAFATERLMLFNAPMLIEVAATRPQADVLLGKPLTARAAAHYYAQGHALDPQWLIDTPQRLRDFADVAAAVGRPLNANIEIDVGLHRGGLPDAAALGDLLDLAATMPHITVTGLMGYEVHVAKVPDKAAAFARALAAFGAARRVLEARLPGDPARFTLNMAGSLTYTLHADETLANEVSLGSALLKPTDFDHPALLTHQPAAFIATPVLKALERTLVPSLERFAGLFALFDPDIARAYYIHGGRWMAGPVHPPGLEYSKLMGRSSNQELLTARRDVVLAPDDFIYLRPTQSEAVLLQFGDLLVVEGGKLIERWPTYPVSA